MEHNYIQIVTYIRRKQTLTPDQFYGHWENVHAPKVVPWAEKHGIIRYQQVNLSSRHIGLGFDDTIQVHVSGTMVPASATASAPNAISKSELPTTAVEFDGIAMFLVPSLEQFTVAFQDPYYLEVIEPDEREFLDKDGPGSGVIASFQGKMLEMMDRGQVSGQEKDSKYRVAFEDCQKKQAELK